MQASEKKMSHSPGSIVPTTTARTHWPFTLPRTHVLIASAPTPALMNSAVGSDYRRRIDGESSTSARAL